MPRLPSTAVRAGVLVALLVVSAASVPTLGGSADDPEAQDACEDVDPAHPESDLNKTWWTYDGGPDRLYLHMEFCADGSDAYVARSNQDIIFLTNWTGPIGSDWALHVWWTGAGTQPTGDNEVRLCEGETDHTNAGGGGIATLIRETDAHWKVRLENGFKALQLEGPISKLRTRVGQNTTTEPGVDPREDCGAPLKHNETGSYDTEEIYERVPDNGTGRTIIIGSFDPEQVRLAGVNLSSPNVNKSTPRGSSVRFSLDVENFLDESDNERIHNLSIRDVELSGSLPGDGWDATFGNTSFRLLPETSDQTNLTIDVPGAIPRGRYPLDVHMVVRNRTGVELGQGNLTFNVTATGPHYHPRISVGNLRRSLPPGGTATSTIRVENSGLFNDTIGLSVSGDRANWTDLSTDQLTLGVDEGSNVKLTVDAPASAEPGTYEHVVTATSEGDPNKTASATVFTEIVSPSDDGASGNRLLPNRLLSVSVVLVVGAVAVLTRRD